MTTEIRVPVLGESITEATIGKWFKAVGDAIAEGEPLVELETDKVTLEVPAPAGGALVEIAAAEGDTIDVGGLLGTINEGAAGAAANRHQRLSSHLHLWQHQRHPSPLRLPRLPCPCHQLLKS